MRLISARFCMEKITSGLKSTFFCKYLFLDGKKVNTRKKKGEILDFKCSHCYLGGL
jgi:hypothetical protein